MAFWPKGEPIEVTYNRETLLTFTWRGYEYHIDAVRNRWRIRTNWWVREVWRDYYEVTTEELWCVLYRDRLNNVWRLERTYE